MTSMLNNGALLLFPKDQLKAPSTVTVVPYQNWKVATGLPAVCRTDEHIRRREFRCLV